MSYVMLPDLQVIFVLVNFIVKSFQKVFMGRLIIGCIIIYRNIIIPNALDKLANCMKRKILEDWSI